MNAHTELYLAFFAYILLFPLTIALRFSLCSKTSSGIESRQIGGICPVLGDILTDWTSWCEFWHRPPAQMFWWYVGQWERSDVRLRTESLWTEKVGFFFPKLVSSGLKLSLRAEVSESYGRLPGGWTALFPCSLSLSHRSSLSTPQSKFPEVKEVSETEMNLLL